MPRNPRVILINTPKGISTRACMTPVAVGEMREEKERRGEKKSLFGSG
jgi:hypothetical protein